MELDGREDLMNIARTTLSSKILSQHKDFFSNLAVDAVLRYDQPSLIRSCCQSSLFNFWVVVTLIDRNSNIFSIKYRFLGAGLLGI